MIKEINLSKGKSEIDLINTNSLNLAFIGDAVWTLMVREFFCSHTQFKNNDLHKLTTKFVKATFQAEALKMIESDLSEMEQDVVRRARNTKMHTVSKNAPLSDYKKATGFEALIGFWYLLNDFDKITMVFEQISKSFLTESNRK